MHPSDRFPNRTGTAAWTPRSRGPGGDRLGQTAERAAAVADGVLFRDAHFSGRALLAVRHEDRDVPESAGSPGLADQAADQRVLAEGLLSRWQHQSGDTAEVSAAALVRDLDELGGKRPEILSIGAMTA